MTIISPSAGMLSGKSNIGLNKEFDRLQQDKQPQHKIGWYFALQSRE